MEKQSFTIASCVLPILMDLADNEKMSISTSRSYRQDDQSFTDISIESDVPGLINEVLSSAINISAGVDQRDNLKKYRIVPHDHMIKSSMPMWADQLWQSWGDMQFNTIAEAESYLYALAQYAKKEFYFTGKKNRQKLTNVANINFDKYSRKIEITSKFGRLVMSFTIEEDKDDKERD